MNNRRLQIFKEELLGDKVAIFSLFCLIGLILLAIFAFLAPYDPNTIDVTNMKSAPTVAHWFGTDEVGRDYFARTLYGARVSLTIGILSMITTIIIGTAVGTISGFYGGIVDSILMRFVDVLSSIPWMILVTIISLFIQGGVSAIVIVIGCFSWMGTSRLVRAETLTLVNREYVLYSKASGQSNFNILTKHILPGIYPTVVVAATVFIPHAIIMESTLSFLGLGVKAPTSSWGSMLKNSQSFLSDAPHLAIIPGIMILLTVFSFNKLGDILRTVVEPKSLGGK